MKSIVYCPVILIVLSITACLSNRPGSGNTPVIQGDYLGQTAPGDSVMLFAPGIISTGMDERDLVITPDGNEVFFCREAGNFRYVTIFYSRRSDGVWSSPEVFEFCTNPEYKYVEPHISPDGTKLYFISDMPADSASEGNEDIWVCAKTDGRWSEPRNPGNRVCK